MKMFKWIEGRQLNVDYKKFCFLYLKIGNIGIDAYILKFKPNTILQWHTDVVENGNHYRWNWTFKGKCDFIYKIKNTIKLHRKNTPIIFRPDINEHKLLTQNEGCKILSFGFVKFKKI